MIRRHNDLSPLKIEEFKILMIFVEKKIFKVILTQVLSTFSQSEISSSIRRNRLYQ